MISQPQTATLTVEVSQAQSTQGMLVEVAQSAPSEAIAKLQDFIALHPDARSCKKSVGSKAGLSRLLV